MRIDTFLLVFLILTPLLAGCLATDEQVQPPQQQDPIVPQDTAEQEVLIEQEDTIVKENMDLEVNFTFDLL